MHTALIEMRGTTSPRLVLELLCARMMLPDAHVDSAALLQRLERLERRLTAGGAAGAAAPVAEPAEAPARAAPARPGAPAKRAAPAKTSAPAAAPEPAAPPAVPAAATPAPAPAAATPAPAPAAATPPPAPVAPAPAPASVEPGALDAAALRRLWPEVLEVVKEASRRTRALLDNAQITNVDGELVSLSAPSALAKMIAEESNTSALRAALTKVVGGEWRVAVDGQAPAAAAAPAERGTPRAAAPEPDPRDDADFEAGPDAATSAPLDPETEAIKLLRSELGARPLEG